MKVCVLGLGYVGSVTAAMLAQSGHSVIGIDIDSHKVDMINKGFSPVSEPQLDEIIKSAISSGNLSASSQINDCSDVDLIFICVGTPLDDDGIPDFSQIKSVLLEIANIKFSKNENVYILNRSTCLPEVHNYAYDLFSDPSNDYKIDYIVHPEFLREGSAINDFVHPSVYIFGSELSNTEIESLANKIYINITSPIITTTISNAALTKYASNAFHALKVSFANEIGAIVKSIDGNAIDVMNMLCRDDVLNISEAYLKPGLPYGGSCLPKDLSTLIYFSQSQDIDSPVLESISKSNNVQIENLKTLILSNKPNAVAILGVAFKSDTDDIRNSPIITLTKLLISENIDVKLWDENLNIDFLIGSNLSVINESIPYLSKMISESLKDAIKDVDVILIAHGKYLKQLESADLNKNVTIIDGVGLPTDSIQSNGIFW